MKRVLSAALLAVSLTACTAPGPLSDGYQFGDGIRTIYALHHDYCTLTTPSQKQAVLAEIRARQPDYTPTCGN